MRYLALCFAFLAFQVNPPSVRSRLEWFDRTGKQIASLGELADYGNLELSPDGSRVAVTLKDPGTAAHDIWLYEVTSGNRVPFASDPADENWLIWSPDGQSVAFNRFSRDG